MRPLLILIAAICLSPKQEGCRIFCAHEGFDGGTYKKGQCLCFQVFDYDIVELKRVGFSHIEKDEK